MKRPSVLESLRSSANSCSQAILFDRKKANKSAFSLALVGKGGRAPSFAHVDIADDIIPFVPNLKH